MLNYLKVKYQAVRTSGLMLLVALATPKIASASWLTSSWGEIFRDIAGAVLQGMSWLVDVARSVLDATVQQLVLNMAENIDSINAISNIWAIIRDFANIVFIFLLLYAAIAIILNLGNVNSKQIIANVLVVALLVNFSFFFSRAVIDVSNVVALQFNNAVQVVDEDGNPVDGNASITEVFASAVNLPSVQDPEILEESANNTESGSGEIDASKLAIIMIAGSAFLLISAFVFLAIALLLLIRFGVLVILMILSPLAFVASILPATKEYAEKWWEELLSQSFFAPAVFCLIYIVAKIITSPNFQGMLASGNGGSIGASLADPSSGVGILLNFGLVTILILAALIIAKQIGAYGASKTVSLGKDAADWTRGAVVGGAAGTAAYAGRRGIGGLGAKIRDSESLKKAASDEDTSAWKRWVAKSALKGGQKTAKSSFDVRNTGMVDSANDVGQRQGGYDEYMEDKEQKLKEEKDLVSSMSPEEERKAEAAKVERDNLEDMKSNLNNDQTEINKKINKLQKKQKEYAEAEGDAKDAVEKQIESLSDELRHDLDSVDDFEDINIPQELESALDTDDGEGVQFDEAQASLEGLRETISNTEDNVDDEINALTETIEKGQRRGEEFVEIKAKQKGVIDKINNSFTKPDEGVQTKANRMFAKGQLDSIENRFESNLDPEDQPDKLRDERISEALGGNISTNIEVDASNTPASTSQNSGSTSTQNDNNTESGSDNTKQQSQEVDIDISGEFPDVPEDYRNELEQAYERAERALSDMEPDEMNNYLKNPKVLEKSDDSDEVRFQGRNSLGQYQDAETGTTEQLGKQDVQDKSSIESTDNSDS